uniref:Uncharacterized protein n=1 Tax=candidate division WOR-3 bacterium TaxID=2052148 RepID=A0A7C2B386_UNCW3
MKISYNSLPAQPVCCQMTVRINKNCVAQLSKKKLDTDFQNCII